jgi:hypothetical protein
MLRATSEEQAQWTCWFRLGPATWEKLLKFRYTHNQALERVWWSRLHESLSGIIINHDERKPPECYNCRQCLRTPDISLCSNLDPSWSGICLSESTNLKQNYILNIIVWGIRGRCTSADTWRVNSWRKHMRTSFRSGLVSQRTALWTEIPKWYVRNRKRVDRSHMWWRLSVNPGWSPYGWIQLIACKRPSPAPHLSLTRNWGQAAKTRHVYLHNFRLHIYLIDD